MKRAGVEKGRGQIGEGVGNRKKGTDREASLDGKRADVSGKVAPLRGAGLTCRSNDPDRHVKCSRSEHRLGGEVPIEDVRPVRADLDDEDEEAGENGEDSKRARAQPSQQGCVRMGQEDEGSQCDDDDLERPRPFPRVVGRVSLEESEYEQDVDRGDEDSGVERKRGEESDPDEERKNR